MPGAVAECFLPPRLHQLPSPSWPEEGDLLNSPPGACVPVRKGRPELAGGCRSGEKRGRRLKTMASGCPHCLFPVVFRLSATDVYMSLASLLSGGYNIKDLRLKSPNIVSAVATQAGPDLTPSPNSSLLSRSSPHPTPHLVR